MSGVIEKIEAIRLRVPLARTLRLGKMVIPDRDYVVVKIHDDEGRVGWSYGLGRNAPVAETISQTIAPIWRGRKLEDHQAFYDLATEANVCLGTNGIFWRALSLCDCALYDLLAKRENTTLAEYLGGSLREVPCMLVGGYPHQNETLESLAGQITQMAALKPAGIKIASTTDYARDTQRLACARKHAGEIPLMIDLFWSANPVEPLIEEARKWRDLGIAWLEDPVPFDHFEEAARLKRESGVPIAIGDEQTGLRQFERLIDEAKVSVIRLDATVCGGVRAFLEIAKMAEERGIEVACHVFSHLHSQLACVASNIRCVEQLPTSFGLESVHELWDSDPAASQGVLHPESFGPHGVGYLWNETKIARHKVGSV